MFTGIVEDIGVVKATDKVRSGLFLKVKTEAVLSDVKIGDSISINGVCLSVTDIKQDTLAFDVIQETLKRTTLGGLKINDPVNLEQSLRPDSRIGGHFVTGHIDYKARIEGAIKDSDGTGFKISLPAEFANLVAKKGSVAIDGVSLTVADVGRKTFTVYLIPHTLKATTLGKRQKGDLVNIELDLLAKYLTRQTKRPQGKGVSDLKDLLKKYDYI